MTSVMDDIELDDDEPSLIGALLARPELLPDAQALACSADFACPGWAAAFEWLATANLKGDRSQDQQAFLRWVKRTKPRFGVSGEELERLLRRVLDYGTGSFVAAHARAVANRAVIRRLGLLRDDLTDIITGRSAKAIDDAPAALERIAKRIADIQTASAKGEPVRLAEALDGSLRELDARLSGGRAMGVQTGFEHLDRLLAGLRAGQFVVLAARPGVGKSALAANIAANVCGAAAGSVLLSSLEMSETELTERLLSSYSGVSHYRMREGTISSAERRELTESAAAMSGWRLRIDARPTQRVSEIVAQARRQQLREGLDLVVIDYLQLIEPDNRREPRQEQVAMISRSLKAAAKSLGVPVLCLAQLNRAADTGEEPRLSHLRESGAIEQDADVVMFIHRAEQAGMKESDAATLIVAKQRSGPTGRIDLAWNKSTVTFSTREMPEHRVDAFDAFNMGN